MSHSHQGKITMITVVANHLRVQGFSNPKGLEFNSISKKSTLSPSFGLTWTREGIFDGRLQIEHGQVVYSCQHVFYFVKQISKPFERLQITFFIVTSLKPQ